MAKSSADDEELRRACEAAIEDTKQKIVMSIRVAKSRGIWGKSGKLGRGHMARPRVLAISTKPKGQRVTAFLRVLKYSNGGVLEPAKLYKLKHLSKVEVVTNDPSGCTFMLEDFYAVVDWAYKIDPLRCISMHGITERYISAQKADAAGFVRILLDDLGSRISAQFGRFVEEACHQIERNERNVRQMGVLSYIPRFATLATRMEQYIQGQSRDLVDQAYTKFQFERLFQFAKRIEDLMYTITPEEIPFELGLSKMDLRKVVKSSLSGVDKSISVMYEKLQKNLTSEDLLPSLWDKCKKEFLDKYDSFAQLVAKVYPTETIPSVAEMREHLASM